MLSCGFNKSHEEPDLDRHKAVNSRGAGPIRRCVHVLCLANDQLDTGDYEFTHELVDIETLNRRAFAADLELTAVSIHAYAYLHEKYILCTCGASMGDGYGPMVVARKQLTANELRNCRIAVPGKLTSAYLALRLYMQMDFDCVEVPFDEVIPAVVAGEYNGQRIDAGLIIHEGQLTYGDQNAVSIWASGGRIGPACRSVGANVVPG